jgi:two-component system cell cycle response regulator DivK
MAGGCKRVLIVDDDSDNRKLFSTLLRSVEGVVVHEAGDGVDALRAVLEHKPDLILLDMDLPLLDGYRAVGMIRACSALGASVPIVALTAASESNARKRCIGAGATDFLAKPVADVAMLRAKIVALLAAEPPKSSPSAAHHPR